METFAAFILGLVLGGLCTLMFIGYSPSSQTKLNIDKIHECQKTIPRNQYCELVAVPMREQPDD